MKTPTALLSVTLCAFVGACIGDVEPAADRTDIESQDVEPIEGKGWNGKGWNSIVFNAVATDPDTIDTLISNPLSTGTFRDPRFQELQYRAGDDEGIQFLDYLAQCALAPDQGFKYLNPRDGSRHTFLGAFGLCPQWNTKAVIDDSACTEAVSACLMARINAFGEPVIISLRGMTSRGDPIGLEDPLVASAQEVASAEACVGTADIGPGATCGWDPGLVGQCIPNQTVIVRKPTGCSMSDDDAYRVCLNESACDRGDSTHVASKTNCSWFGSTTSFTCPESGAFTLMQHTGSRPGYTVPRIYGGGVNWPASELDIFKFREGAFFGQLFDGSKLGLLTRLATDTAGNLVKEYSTDDGVSWSTQQPQGRFTAFRGMYVCHSGSWEFDEVLAKKRVCAGSTGWSCAAMHVGNCSSTFTHPEQNMDLRPLYPHGVCKDDDSPAIKGDLDYDNCIDPDTIDPNTGEPKVWAYPITTFLTSPCSAPYANTRDRSGRLVCSLDQEPDPPIGPRPILPRPISPFVGVSR